MKTGDTHVKQQVLCAPCVFLLFCFFLFVPAGGGVISGQRRTYFFQKHMFAVGSSGAAKAKKKKHTTPTKPPHDCRCCCCVSVCDRDDKQTEGFSLPFHFFQMSHDADQTLWRLALNVPRLECLPLMRGKKTVMLSEQLLSAKVQNSTRAPRPSTYGDFRPRPLFLEDVKSGWGGGGRGGGLRGCICDRRAQKNRFV